MISAGGLNQPGEVSPELFPHDVCGSAVCCSDRSLNDRHLTWLMSRDLTVPEGMVRFGENPVQRDSAKNNGLSELGGVD